MARKHKHSRRPVREADEAPVDAGLPASETRRASDPASSLLAVVLASSMDGIAVFHAIRGDDGAIVDFEFVTVSSAAERLLGGDATDLLGTRLTNFRPTVPAERLARYAQVVETGTTLTTRVQWIEGEPRWLDITAASLAPDGLVAIFRDVTDRLSMDELMEESQRRQHVLERQALHDPLTGAANRLLVEARLEHAVSRLDRTATSLAVMFIDLDGFKSINDNFGHAAGDAVLVEMANRLRSAARSYDTVGRIGGDEFVVVCEDLDEEGDIDRIAHRLNSVCEAPIAIGDQRVVVTASVGVAIAHSSSIDPAALLHDADMAMYRAKTAGGGRVEYLNHVLHAQTLVRRDIEVGLQRAVTDNQLRLEFDPVLAPDGVEVARRPVVSWHHPRHGLVDARALADAADTMGILAHVTDWLFDEALDRLASWLTAPTDPPRLAVLDIDGRVLGDAGFVERLSDVLQRHGCEPRSLCLALDGAYLTAHVDELKTVLDQLTALGVRIARNGVGAAGSALTYLREVHIDVLILDTSLTDDPRRPNALLQPVINLAKGGNRIVMASAVTTSEQRELLGSLGVDLLHVPRDAR